MSYTRLTSQTRVFCLLLVLLAAGAVFPAYGQEVSQTRNIAAGLTYHHYSSANPWSIHVLEIDLFEPTLALEAYRASGLVRTSEQAAENKAKGNEVLAAINADFFTSVPPMQIGNHIQNGLYVSGVQSTRTHFIQGMNRKVYMERLSYNGLVALKSGRSWGLDGVNIRRVRRQFSLCNAAYGPKTSSDSSHTDIALKFIGRRNSDTIQAVVVQKTPYGGTDLSQFDCVLMVGRFSPATGLSSAAKVSDTLIIIQQFNPSIPRPKEVLGGGGRVLENGKVLTSENVAGDHVSSDFVTRRHPRTFLGIDRDTTKLYLCVVDGRQEASVGMNFEEMGKFLLQIGCWNGMNFDGGGSTTMVVEGAIVNSPSDMTGERKVANTLQVIKGK